MHALLRTSVFVVLVGVVSLTVFSLRDACVQRDWLRESRRREEIHYWQQLTWRHQEGQYQAVQEWLSQRCTSAETMQRFQELEQVLVQERPIFRDHIGKKVPLTDAERHRLVILKFVNTILHDQPEELELARRRLEHEYQQLQAGNQTFRTTTKDARARRDGMDKQSAGVSSSR